MSTKSKSKAPEAASLMSFIKSDGLKLLPFVITIGIYFYNFIPEDQPSNYAMMLKCLPILSLALFVYLLGLDNPLREKVFRGLLLSCIGDACLLWEQDAFIYGVVAFGLAQMHFIAAHGLTPRKWGVLGFILLAALPGVTLIFPGLTKQPFAMQAAVSLYSPLLLGMVWRSVTRSREALDNGIEDWSLECASFGGILFFISDSVLSMNKFYKPIPYHQLIVMVTYYGSQLATSLSSFSEGPTSKAKKR